VYVSWFFLTIEDSNVSYFSGKLSPSWKEQVFKERNDLTSNVKLNACFWSTTSFYLLTLFSFVTIQQKTSL
jgi:hypothetical protein